MQGKPQPWAKKVIWLDGIGMFNFSEKYSVHFLWMDGLCCTTSSVNFLRTSTFTEEPTASGLTYVSHPFFAFPGFCRFAQFYFLEAHPIHHVLLRVRNHQHTTNIANWAILLLYRHHFLCCLFKLGSNRKGSKPKRILPHNLPQIETLTSWATFYFIGYHTSHTYFTNFERCFLVHRILWSSCRSSFRQAWRLSHRGRNLPLLVGEQNNLRQYGDLEKVA